MALADIGQTLNNASNQGYLERALHSLFPRENILTDQRKETRIKNPHTGKYLEIDVWIPSLGLCFEFQDSYHYTSAWYTQLTVEAIQLKDRTKENTVRQFGETLILVPCWWNGHPGSLARTVVESSESIAGEIEWPSLLVESPIPLNPPNDYFLSRMIPDVGELMLASFPLSFGFVTHIDSITPWWMGEKYDGIRCCWHPARKRLYSRKGHKLYFYSSLSNTMPSLFLDGEIWFGRDYFPECQRLISPTEDIYWPFLRAIVFDEPSIESRSLSFERRYKNILSHVNPDHPFTTIASRQLCISKAHAKRVARELISQQSEGIVLREMFSTYLPGRNNSLYKLKTSREDCEALVVKVGKKLTTLRMPSGLSFKIDSKGNQGAAAGDVVTFTVLNFTRHSLPVDPRVLRVRRDCSWADFVAQDRLDRSSSSPSSSFHQDVAQVQRRVATPQKYWTDAKLKSFFETFARNSGADPLVPETWYNISRKQISDLQGGEAILTRFRGGFAKTLIYLFPDIGLREDKFSVLPQKFTMDVNNRKKLFLDYARSKGFDPLVPENWYKVTDNIHDLKGIKTTLRGRKRRFGKTLISIFPEIGLDISRFSILPVNYYSIIHNRRNAFDTFAKERGFDPLIADNWYSISFRDFESIPGIHTITRNYNSSYVATLLELYPDIGLVKHKFPVSNFWNDARNQRDFFILYAKKHEFDPLVPSNWYGVTATDISRFRGGNVIIRYYHGSIIEALLAVFPDIHLEKDKFPFKPRNFWKNKANHKQFFIHYAESKGFDPLAPSYWHSVSSKSFLPFSGSTEILRVYGSFRSALMDLFPDIGLDGSLFQSSQHSGHWNSVKNQRKFLENFAKVRHCDPLLPSTWHSLSSVLLANPIGKTILRIYKGDLENAIGTVFHTQNNTVVPP